MYHFVPIYLLTCWKMNKKLYLKRKLSHSFDSPGTLKASLSCVFVQDGLEGSRLPHFQLLGLLGLEHCGKPRHENDGLSFSLFVVIRTTCEEGLKTTSSRYQWMDLEGDLREQVLKRIDKPRSVPYLT